MTDLKKDSSGQSVSKEYKFRVFTPLHHHSDTIKMSEKMYYCDSFLMVHKATHTHGDESPEIARPFIIMQYTGLKDKNGVDIYEGDIVKYESTTKYFDGKTISTDFLTVVTFDLGSYCEKIIKYEVEKQEDEFFEKWLEDKKKEMMKGFIAMSVYDNSGKTIKPVIGNIYQNAELLSEK